MALDANEKGILLSREFAAQGQDAATAWRAQNRPGDELFWLLQATQHALSDAVQSTADPDSGALHLQKEYLLLLTRTHGLFLVLFEGSTSASQGPPPSIAAPIVLTLALWLLNRFAEGSAVARLLPQPPTAGFFQSDPIWSSYASGLAALSTGKPYTAPTRKFTGYDRHWATYLSLMEAYCNRLDFSSAIRQVNASFEARNSDHRLIGDCLFGDGEYPVRWDFQLAALQRFVGTAARTQL